jgi:hypothetical protein
MKQFSEWMQLNEAANTLLSDINETATGQFIFAGTNIDIMKSSTWYDEGAKKQFFDRLKEVSKEDGLNSIEQGRAMAKAFLANAEMMKYSKVQRVYWTARPNSMSAAVGEPVDQKKNPADLLIKFQTGPANGFLGLSAKATKGKADIGLKNPGAGTFDTALKNLNVLDVSFKDIITAETEAAVNQFNLPASAVARKTFLKTHPKVAVETDKVGYKLLMILRDELFKALSKLTKKPKLFSDFLLQSCIDADIIYPPYIKVTGHGNYKSNYASKSYTATVVNPIDNPKIKDIVTRKFSVAKSGDHAVGIKANNTPIVQARWKYESQKLGSSVKLSVEPYKG